VECGKQFKVTAVAEEGVRFVRWSDGETANPRIVTATEDMTFTAIFEYIPIQENCPYSGTCGDNLTWELNCEGVLTISGTGEMTSSPWLAYRDFITSVFIYNGVTSIADAAFSGCTGLTSIIIPSNLSNIGRGILSDCDALSNIETPAMYFNEGVEFDIFTIGATRPNKLESIIINGGELTSEGFDFIRESYRSLTSIDMSQAENTTLPDEALRDCYNLRSIKLPAALEQIGYMAVAECKNLQAVNIPASVIEIAQSAFENCRSLKSITFGEQVSAMPGRLNIRAASTSALQRIGNWAFYNCHALQGLEIPEGVTEIGEGAFYGCTYMENLSLPASMQAIGDNTFSLCTKIKKMFVDAVTPPSIQAKTFFEVDRKTPVYVPDESVDAYKNDAYWKEFFIQGRSNISTGVGNVQGDNAQCTKILLDGHIYILRGEHVYDVQGKMVK
jgi:hypothetical protein